MNYLRLFKILSLLLLVNGCITQFVPEVEDDKELIVVEGLITDQPGINTIKLSKSYMLWKKPVPVPLKNCKVWIYDDLGEADSLKEIKAGTYVTDPSQFKGETGRTYTLHIKTAQDYGGLNYESIPAELQPVPPVGNVYYEKKNFTFYQETVEGCQFYVDTYDPTGKCKYYRWDYVETWEFHLPYLVDHRICWVSNNCRELYVKNAAVLDEGRVVRFPLNQISNPIDRLEVKYSLLVNQYSLSEEEYQYWERIKNVSEQAGSLYDIMPSTVPGNIYCIEDPHEKVLGHFSVSAVSSKRIFVKDYFTQPVSNEMYFQCPSDTIYGANPVVPPNNWVIIDNSDSVPPNVIVTNNIGCADCRARGTDVKPVYWNDGK